MQATDYYALASVTWRQELKAYDEKVLRQVGKIPAFLLAILFIVQTANEPRVKEPVVILEVGIVIAFIYLGMWTALGFGYLHSRSHGGHDVGWIAQDCEASVLLSKDGNYLIFRVTHQAAWPLEFRTDQHGFTSLTGFSVVSQHEWFSTPEEREELMDTQVIIAEFSNRAPMPVGQFGNPRRTDISQVFLDLQNRILNRRREIMATAEEMSAQLRSAA